MKEQGPESWANSSSHGDKRIGVVTLAIACVCMAGWTRSLSIEDTVRGGRDGNAWYVSSVAGRIYAYKWQREWMENESTNWSTDKVLIMSSQFDPMRGLYAEPRRWDWAGFHFGRVHLDRRSPWQSCTVPYWSIVIPLTLISAYLILTKPRNTTPQTIVEEVRE